MDIRFRGHRGGGIIHQISLKCPQIRVDFYSRPYAALTEEMLIQQYTNMPSFRAKIESGRFIYIHRRLMMMNLKTYRFREKTARVREEKAVIKAQSYGGGGYGSLEIHGAAGTGKSSVIHNLMPSGDHIEVVCSRGAGSSTQPVVFSDSNGNVRRGLMSLTPTDVTKIIDGGFNPPGNDFPSALVGIMNATSITVEKLAELTGISPKTIQRMRTDDTYTPSLQYVCAICIALHLFPQVSCKLISLAGLSFKNNHDDNLYSLLIYTQSYETVYNCNEFLVRHNATPLTTLNKE